MTTPDAPSPLVWQDGQPRSRLFGDIYYSLEDGLAETQAVFLDGCDLPRAWTGRRRFCVAELGFGTGLNIAALLDLWGRTRPPGGHLHIFSVEGFPLSRDEAAQALGAWPQIAPAADALLDQWPTARRGWHRLDFPTFGATLDLAVMDVEAALTGWGGQADAWFLDGFAPALNPDMWRDDILALVGARSATGAMAATFTVAGQVRRGLAAAGFEVAKRPGHGRKRERLEAIMPGARPANGAVPSVVIIGGGIAGACLSRAFADLGLAAKVLAQTDDAMASGNRAALVTPALDAGGGPRAAFYAQAVARAATLYNRTPGAVIAKGVLQLEAAPRDAARFDAVAAQDLFEPGAMVRLGAAETSHRLHEDSTPAALLMSGARVVAPAPILQAWAPQTIEGAVVSLARQNNGWRIDLADGQSLAADIVVLAAGLASTRFADLPLKPVRGQATFCPTDAPVIASASGSYAIPAPGGVLFGATHDRDHTDVDVRTADHDRNRAALATVRPTLAAAIADAPAEGRAALRATTPDRMPIAGALAPGLFVLSGLGSRGFTTAPLLAEHVAALATGAPSPLPRDAAALVAPYENGRRVSPAAA